MGVAQTQLFPPPAQSPAVDDSKRLAPPLRQWLFTVQNLLPLVTVHTSGGPESIALPPAGLNSTTGQSNQNQEIIYLKTSADGNAVTITGAETGDVTLNAQLDCVRFKSDGTSWYQVAFQSGSPSGGVTSVFGRTGAVVAQAGDYAVGQVTGAAPLASPALTGTPTSPTPAAGDNSTKIATTAYVQGLGGAPFSGIAPFDQQVLKYFSSLGKWSPGWFWNPYLLVGPNMGAGTSLWARLWDTASFCGNVGVSDGSATSIAGTSTHPILTKFTSSAVATSSAGFNSGQPGWMASQFVRVFNISWIQLAQLVNMRLWIGCQSKINVSSVFRSDTPNAVFVGFRFSTNAGDTHWKAICQTDNTHQTVVDTGIAPDLNLHNWEVRWDDVQYKFFMDGVLVATITTNIPNTAGDGVNGFNPVGYIDNVGVAVAVAYSCGFFSMETKTV